MAKKTKRVETKAEVKQVKAQEAKTAQKTPKHQVKARDFLKTLNIEWVLDRGLDEGDITILNAKVQADKNGEEWASWLIQYRKPDGTPVKGIAWGISAPVKGGLIVMRLIDGKTRATLKVWPSGKGLITGVEPVVKALLARPDIRPWTDEDTAALL